MRLLFIIVLLTSLAFAGPIGVFQGELAGGPQSGWLYVKGKNGMFRRVLLGEAPVTFSPQVPAERRTMNPSTSLVAGAVVRVTAEQGSDGEWRAREVVLVRLAASQSRSVTLTSANPATSARRLRLNY